MSTNGMNEILSRLFLDGEFRQQLRNDPETTLADFDLTPEQRARLFRLKKQILPDEMAQAAPTKINVPYSLN